MTNFAMRRSFCFALVWPDTVAEHPNGFLDAEQSLRTASSSLPARRRVLDAHILDLLGQPPSCGEPLCDLLCNESVAGGRLAPVLQA
jgi:hypothetical protein